MVEWVTIGGRQYPVSEIYHPAADYLTQERESRITELHDEFFWRVFLYLQMNMVAGDYAEFGTGCNVRSFRLAHKYNTLMPADRKLYGFDSFEGLPEPSGRDAHPVWQKGAMSVGMEEFHVLMGTVEAREGEHYRAVKGFFDLTLRGKAPSDYGMGRVAFAHVDCDLYESAKDVLAFVLPAMSHGGVLSFDDWFCFYGEPDKGEQAAFSEARSDHPELSFVEYLGFGWHGKSFIVHRR